jgi:hypothetical protein
LSLYNMARQRGKTMTRMQWPGELSQGA